MREPGTEEQPVALFLMGPTAAGKTALAVALAQRGPFEIISVDSVQVYRGMNIGAAKPDAATLRIAPHRLIDILDPAESYSAARFRADALREMAAIRAARRIPLLVGGTMLYFHALRYGLSDLPPADRAVRQRLDAERAAHGVEALYARLRRVDPVGAARIDARDAQRIQRALEVYELTGAPISRHYGAPRRDAFDWRVAAFAVAPRQRATLHRRIEARFRRMAAQGLEEEVRALMARGDLSPRLPSIRSVGYRQAWAWLAGECDREEMMRRGVAATRQLAKRQLTRLRAWPDLHWFDLDAAGGAEEGGGPADDGADIQRAVEAAATQIMRRLSAMA